jgi:hypothetical protein
MGLLKIKVFLRLNFGESSINCVKSKAKQYHKKTYDVVGAVYMCRIIGDNYAHMHGTEFNFKYKDLT